MNAKQIKESEGDEAIARMAHECAGDEPVAVDRGLIKNVLFALRYRSDPMVEPPMQFLPIPAPSRTGRAPQRTVKETLDDLAWRNW